MAVIAYTGFKGFGVLWVRRGRPNELYSGLSLVCFSFGVRGADSIFERFAGVGQRGLPCTELSCAESFGKDARS